MENLIIAKVLLSNLYELMQISRVTFLETFSDSNSSENMQIYLDNSFSADKLKLELSNENSEFYFAKIEERIIGYLKLNSGKSQTELQNDNSIELERIYVLKEFYGKNVGQLLLAKAIEFARQKNADFVWLGVWEKNQRAINFYKKNNFKEFDKHIFQLGNDAQTDLMMQLPLK